MPCVQSTFTVIPYVRCYVHTCETLSIDLLRPLDAGWCLYTKMLILTTFTDLYNLERDMVNMEKIKQVHYFKNIPVYQLFQYVKCALKVWGNFIVYKKSKWNSLAILYIMHVCVKLLLVKTETNHSVKWQLNYIC